MTLREILYNSFKIQFPTSEPLSTDLSPLINSDGTVKQLPELNLTDVRGFIPTETQQQKRERLFNSMTINQNIVDLNSKILVSNVPQKVISVANRIILNKQRYVNVAHRFANPIKWFHVALIHQMEGGGNFSTYLGNGQSIYKKTTIVPKGRGPFSTFELGAIDAIKLKLLDQVSDWSIGNTLYILESFNGFGYELYKGINSPYLWSGSNQYVSGYYPADSVYSKTLVSQQIGIALILKQLISMGVTN